MVENKKIKFTLEILDYSAKFNNSLRAVLAEQKGNF